MSNIYTYNTGPFHENIRKELALEKVNNSEIFIWLHDAPLAIENSLKRTYFLLDYYYYYYYSY